MSMKKQDANCIETVIYKLWAGENSDPGQLTWLLSGVIIQKCNTCLYRYPQLR